jgi:hypothetical protein
MDLQAISGDFQKMADKVTVGYIAGSGHSGSTLIDLLLGSQPRIASFGELKKLDDVVSGKASNGSCTCGAAIADCQIWGPVLTAIAERGFRTHSVDPKYQDFLEMNATLLEALSKVSSRNILVDSSKSLNRLRGLLKLDRTKFETRILHVVRDGRAVGYSNARKGRDLKEFVAKWAETNRAISKVVTRDVPYLLVRYEDLVIAPSDTVRQMAAFLGASLDRTVSLDWAARTKHNVGGNRMRRKDTSAIRYDNEYVREISDEDWEDVTAQNSEDLAFFGYRAEKSDQLDVASSPEVIAPIHGSPGR